MLYQKTINGREVFVTVTPIAVENNQGEFVHGQFVSAFAVDRAPGFMLAGEHVKDNNGRTTLFGNETEARDAGFSLAEVALK